MTLSLKSGLEAVTGKRHLLWRYGLAVFLFAATIGLSLLLTNLGIRINLTIPVVLALAATAWYCGRGPGLLISVLFQTTTIIYTTIPPDSNMARVAFSYFSVFSLYVFMVFVISGLNRVQRRLSEQRDLLQVTLSSIGDGVITTDTKGVVTFMNPVAKELTGWGQSSANGVPLDEVFRIVSEETGEIVANPVERVLATGSMVALSNHTVLRSKSGRNISIDDSAAPIRNGNTIKGVVLVFSDVSERKAAERSRRETEIMHRIVEAQEAERHRIARDLHDHLGQKMTALRLSIESLTDKCADNPTLGNAIGELQASASHIDRDIGFLSWELRPTELEDLGLVDALSSFVREWSRQHGIATEFHPSRIGTEDNYGRLDLSIETNLYRIVQEALNNVLKHSEAKNVSVLLQRRKDHIVLIIEDNGLGFEPQHDYSTSTKPGGHGLVGMHERAALLNGTLEIDTRPGSGTTILAQIPI